AGAGPYYRCRRNSPFSAAPPVSRARPRPEALDMPNDAKLGLVVGVGLVIAVAVVFFRRDLTARPAGESATAVAPSPSTRPPAPRPLTRPVRGRPMAREAEDGATPRRHTVPEGETRGGLAEHYYGDAARSADLRRANAEALAGSSDLTPGTVLVVPELDQAADVPGS